MKYQIFKYIISEFKMLSARVYSNIGKRRCKLHTSYLTCSETKKDEERKNGIKLKTTLSAVHKNEQMVERNAQPTQPIPGGSEWKNPIHYNTVMPPLERQVLKKQKPTKLAIIEETEPEEIDLYEERIEKEGRGRTYYNDFINIFATVGILSVIVFMNLQPIRIHLAEIKQEKEERKRKELAEANTRMDLLGK